jgi:HK97 gp10 family phage protein
VSETIRLDWRGAQVRAQLEIATIEGINETTEDCVQDAKANHPFTTRTGTAVESIQRKPATASATKISGRYGGRKIRYFFYLEFGTSKMQAFPTLRPAADRNYPKLVGRIRARANVT